MGLVNTITLEGIISEHLDIRYFSYEHLRLRLQLHTIEEGLKADGSDWEQWHRIELNNELAKEAEAKLKKGDRIRVEGRIAYHKELDREGKKRYITVIHARAFSLLGCEIETEEHRPVEEEPLKEELPWQDFKAQESEDPMA